ncbi:hypothetical protein JOC77_001051 [Peribacillus deserti]|uniref:DUF1643 domain-containing protein n=1 Tax=Peribacillus deserti TaxID=673318 RepID=A0ABS2QES3_9BACI|nr:DUF1643 domain-containing protein [Peribacillus deserti]MBM7691644.1 hypothetical protein [Peribacillus deserti]
MKKTNTSFIKIESTVDDALNKRYSLKKTWAKNEEAIKKFVVIMHNPNVANEIKGDKSSNLCLNKAVDEGCNEIITVNLYATRGPKSAQLSQLHKIVEYQNLESIKEALDGSEKLLLAWGDNPGPMVRDYQFIRLLSSYEGEIKCFRINISGEPCHASLCGEETPLQDFNIIEYFNRHN